MHNTHNKRKITRKTKRGLSAASAGGGGRLVDCKEIDEEDSSKGVIGFEEENCFGDLNSFNNNNNNKNSGAS